MENFYKVILYLENKGVFADQYGLIKPNFSEQENILSKIIDNLIEVKKKIDKARLSGKHVLYMPGSYDLIHVGHAFYVDQAINQYLSLCENKHLSRNDIVVFILADADELIYNVKASKWIGNGGTEPFRRPIQSDIISKEIFSHVNWRLIDLASIPYIDIVSFIPSPLFISDLDIPEVVGIQKEASEINLSLVQFQKDNTISPDDVNILLNSVSDYEELLKAIVNKKYDYIINSFNLNKPPWSIQAWQLFLHIYLGFGKDMNAPFVRVISVHDGIYKNQVSFIMSVASIKCFLIHDDLVCSTTDLLKEYGHEDLLNSKKNFYIKKN